MRALLIGIDGLDFFNCTVRYKKRMPCINSLTGDAVHGIAEAVILPGHTQPYTIPNWYTIYTGKVKHVYEIGSFINVYAESLFCDIRNRKALITMPFTYPAVQLNGYMVSGFPAPKERYLPKMVYPRKLLHIFGDLPLKNTNIEHMPFNELVNLEKNKLEITFSILKERPVEFLAYGLSTLDVVMHYAPEYTEKYHEFVDSIVARLLVTLKPKKVAIVSDHGWDLEERQHSTNAFYAILMKGCRRDIQIQGLNSILRQYFEIPEKKEEIKEEHKLSKQEKEEILNRLKRLGYKEFQTTGGE